MKLKVCGMKYADNIREVAEFKPDFMGFIFYPKSKRYVGADFVIPEISSDIKRVGVFVNEPLESIGDKIKKYALDFVQLHGDESADYCNQLFQSKARSNCKIIKAFGIDEQFDFSILKEYESCCEYFMFDTKTTEYGGSGTKFDSSILNKYRISKPFFLSGGVGIGISADPIIKHSQFFAVDVNSKFENGPGLKDIHKLKILKDELSGKR